VTLSTVEVAAFFAASVYLPLADVITYYLAAPIFVTAASALFLGEKVGWRRWSAILVGFVGVMIALRPSTQAFSWPAMIALAGSASFAALMIITRSLRGTPDGADHGSILRNTAVRYRGGAVRLDHAKPADFGLFAVAGCISIGAAMCVNRSLKLAPASVVTPINTP
jgi:drug/metabolite transporter (DMT)-like permease